MIKSAVITFNIRTLTMKAQNQPDRKNPQNPQNPNQGQQRPGSGSYDDYRRG